MIIATTRPMMMARAVSSGPVDVVVVESAIWFFLDDSFLKGRVLDRTRMLRLIQTEPPSARQLYCGQNAPGGLLHIRALNALGIESRDRLLEVLTHQIQLVPIVFIARMRSDFSRWQSKDQPS